MPWCHTFAVLLLLSGTVQGFVQLDNEIDVTNVTEKGPGFVSRQLGRLGRWFDSGSSSQSVAPTAGWQRFNKFTNYMAHFWNYDRWTYGKFVRDETENARTDYVWYTFIGSDITMEYLHDPADLANDKKGGWRQFVQTNFDNNFREQWAAWKSLTDRPFEPVSLEVEQASHFNGLADMHQFSVCSIEHGGAFGWKKTAKYYVRKITEIPEPEFRASEEKKGRLWEDKHAILLQDEDCPIRGDALYAPHEAPTTPVTILRAKDTSNTVKTEPKTHCALYGAHHWLPLQNEPFADFSVVESSLGEAGIMRKFTVWTVTVEVIKRLPGGSKLLSDGNRAKGIAQTRYFPLYGPGDPRNGGWSNKQFLEPIRKCVHKEADDGCRCDLELLCVYWRPQYRDRKDNIRYNDGVTSRCALADEFRSYRRYVIPEDMRGQGLLRRWWVKPLLVSYYILKPVASDIYLHRYGASDAIKNYIELLQKAMKAKMKHNVGLIRKDASPSGVKAILKESAQDLLKDTLLGVTNNAIGADVLLWHFAGEVFKESLNQGLVWTLNGFSGGLWGLVWKFLEKVHEYAKTLKRSLSGKPPFLLGLPDIRVNGNTNAEDEEVAGALDPPDGAVVDGGAVKPVEGLGEVDKELAAEISADEAEDPILKKGNPSEIHWEKQREAEGKDVVLEGWISAFQGDRQKRLEMFVERMDVVDWEEV